MFFIIIPLFLIYIPLSSGFLFGNAGGVNGCSCPQPVCQPSLPPCPLPSSAPISNNGAYPIIVNCAGNVGGSGCVSGSAADRSEDAILGPKLAEHAINVVLVSQHGGNDKNCIDNPVNKGEGKCGDEQQSINLVLDGNEGEPHKGESAGEYANKPAGCNDETRPCDIRIEHEQMQGKSNVWQPQQYASANNGQDYTAQLQQSGGYAQKQSANIGYAQKGVDYASQRPPSIGYTSQLHRSGEYNAQLQQSVQPEPDQYQRPPILASEPQSPGSYISESGPAEQPYQQPTSEVQPAASESESSYSGSENAAAAAAGDRLQEVQEDTIESSTKEINNSTVIFMPHSSITSSTVSVVATAENFQIETSTQQLHAGQQHKSSNEQHDVFIDPVDISLLKLTNDTECNNDELRTIIKKNLPYELNIAKRQIQLQAEARFGGRFDVICSHHDFSYITNTELWCQETRESTSCYAYRQLGY